MKGTFVSDKKTLRKNVAITYFIACGFLLALVIQ